MTALELLERGERLVTEGRSRDAIALLTEANRTAPSYDIERRLVRMRHEAFMRGTPDRLRAAPPALAIGSAAEMSSLPDPFPEIRDTPPEITLGEMKVDVVRGAIANHGCLIVRGLIDADRAAMMAEHTDRAMSRALRWGKEDAPAPDEWYAPFEGSSALNPFERVWTRQCGTLYAGDCPRILFELIEIYRDVGLDRLSAEYFGDQTAISLQKCAVRRVGPEDALQHAKSMWHQDGRFLGADTRALNLWIAFTDAGGDSPGMDVVPRRFGSLVESGTGSASFDWTVGDETVRQVAGDAPPVSPVFAAGDAILFDEMFLHSTSVKPGMSRHRISSECWFIAESTYPNTQWVPLAL